MANWMIYGANGYTGELVAEEAIKRGHRPVLAGRSAKKLRPLAERLGLESRVFDLDNIDAIASSITGMDVVYHAAGPFIYTSNPMIQACLRTKTHYLDITGEYNVFENSFMYDNQAGKAGIAVISGAGFDVIPSDCLSKYVADQVPNATQLEIGINAVSRASGGTTKSALEMISTGGRMRRNGELVYHQFGSDIKKLRFPDGDRMTINFPWGDIATAYRTTKIPNITTYFAFSNLTVNMFKYGGGMTSTLMGNNTIKSAVQKIVGWTVRGPNEKQRTTGKSYVYAKATNPAGESVEAWMETIEAYYYTAKIGVLCVERMLKNPVTGAITPAMAFGKDFALEVEGTKRYDSLP